MSKLVITHGPHVISVVTISRERTTIGRRAYNDLVLDAPTVSGEHAVLLAFDDDVFIEDLGSTNGTYVNNRAVRRILLHSEDRVAIGSFALTFKTQPGMAHPSAETPLSDAVRYGCIAEQVHARIPASIKVLDGALTGNQVFLTKVVTPIAGSGRNVVSIIRQPAGYFLARVDREHPLKINDEQVPFDPAELRNGDIIYADGVRMQFVHA
ncbi:FHA domain-containing protein [Ideonella sp. DXS29W]|uniref:FHA domain-containing protein n=1 Tax=Ideonella lacteola TaxID=2984193 RepID=A0ABU9BZ02_9BURK